MPNEGYQASQDADNIEGQAEQPPATESAAEEAKSSQPAAD